MPYTNMHKSRRCMRGGVNKNRGGNRESFFEESSIVPASFPLRNNSRNRGHKAAVFPGTWKHGSAAPSGTPSRRSGESRPVADRLPTSVQALECNSRSITGPPEISTSRCLGRGELYLGGGSARNTSRAT